MSGESLSSDFVSAEEAEALDRRFVFHPFTNLAGHLRSDAPVIVAGEGSTVRDARGRSYLDAMGGLWCVNVGYGRREIADALRDEALRLGYYHAFSSMATDLPAEVAERVIDLYPAPMSKVFFGNSGSDANDTQVKLVWYYNNLLGRPEKKKIISRQRAYHGVTVVSASLTGLTSLHEGFDLPLPMIRHTTAPHRFWEALPDETDEDFAARLAGDLEQLILAEGPETVAAFIGEPLQGAGGVIVPPHTYWERIQEVLRTYDVLLICDEVICGFGRLGYWFGSERYDIRPDVVTFAKGVGSAHVPLGGVLISDKVSAPFLEGTTMYNHGITYGGHPVSCAVALKNLEVMERLDVLGNVRSNESYFRGVLDKLAEKPIVGDVRGAGYFMSLELVKDKDTKETFSEDESEHLLRNFLSGRLYEAGLICRADDRGDPVIQLSPPLVATRDDLDYIHDVLDTVLDEAWQEMTRGRSRQAVSG